MLEKPYPSTKGMLSLCAATMIDLEMKEGSREAGNASFGFFLVLLPG